MTPDSQRLILQGVHIRLQNRPLFAPLNLTIHPGEVVEDALAAKVDAIGISSLAAGHLTLVPQLMEQLKARGRGDVLVLVGGVIPAQDYEALRAAGVAAIFGPGTNIPDAARSVLGLIRARRRRNTP